MFKGCQTKKIMNDNEAKILRILQKNKGYCLTYKSLSFFSRVSEREVRAAVASLVTDGIAPICGSQQGYTWISNQEQYELASNELLSRIKMLSRRHKGLRRAWQEEKKRNEFKPYQMEMV